MEEFRGLVRVFARAGDELCNIAGPACPYSLPIAGEPLIAHAVKALQGAGVRQILLAVDEPIAEPVLRIVGSRIGADVDVAIVPADDDSATIRAVEQVLGAGPLVIVSGETLLPAGFALRQDTVYLWGATPVAWTLRDLPEDDLGPGEGSLSELDGGWHYDGTIDGVLEANTMALDNLKRGRMGVDLSNTLVQGRVQIDPTAELDGAKLRGPVYIGPGARIVETYVGPYTSISADVTLEGVEIEHSIVLPGAQIRYPGRRLEASIVGEGAQIGRDYSLPSALRLRVGPGSEIQLG